MSYEGTCHLSSTNRALVRGCRVCSAYSKRDVRKKMKGCYYWLLLYSKYLSSFTILSPIDTVTPKNFVEDFDDSSVYLKFHEFY